MKHTTIETKRARLELRDLKRAENKVLEDGVRASKAIDRQRRAIELGAIKALRALDRLANKQRHAVDRALGRITHRIGILEGRLA